MTTDIPYGDLETELRKTVALKGHEGEQLRDIMAAAGFTIVPDKELKQLRADADAHNADLAGTVEWDAIAAHRGMTVEEVKGEAGVEDVGGPEISDPHIRKRMMRTDCTL